MNEVEALVSLADAVAAGVCVDGVPLNARMREWAQQWGAGPFLLPAGVESGELRLHERDGRAHRFRRTRFAMAAGEGLWVQDCAPDGGRFARMQAPGHNPALRMGLDGAIRYANAAAAELLGYAAGDEPATFARRLAIQLRRALDEQADTAELELGPRLLAFSLAGLEGADELWLFGRDISERRYAEAALRRSEERFRRLLERAPDAFIISSADGSIDYANPRTAELFGHRAADLQGQSVPALVPDWHRSGHLRGMFQGGTGARPPAAVATLEGVHASGWRFPLEISSSPLERDGGVYAVSILRDVTERERAAREIRELNEHLERHVAQLTALNGELEAFSYSVSHDLRGPLRAMEGFSAILLEDYQGVLDETGRGYLARIRAATARMSDLIEGLLRLSRITRSPLHREPVDLSAIARFIADGLCRETPEREAEFVIAEGVEGQGDRALLTVVLENLLGNAWKFTAGRPARIEFGANCVAGETVYFVRDNGAGFDMRDAGKLFQPFERLHRDADYPGSGIGLATVQRVVRRHGGRIWAEGVEGQGACFQFTLGAPRQV